MFTFINGIRFPNTTLAQLLPLLQTTRVKAEPLAETILGRAVLAMACNQVDLLRLTPEAPEWLEGFQVDRAALQCAQDLLQAKQAEMRATMRRAPDIDIDCEVVLIPHGSDVLGVLYCEQAELAQLVRDLGEPYAYWDGDERPDSVSEENWVQCKTDWTTALNPFAWRPGMAGLTYTLSGLNFMLSPNLSEENMPSVEQRARALGDLWASQFLSKQGQNPADLTFSQYGQLLRSPEYQAFAEERKKELPPLSKADLKLPMRLATDSAS